ncbi:MAG: hypothetical protein ACYC2O_04495, partial [Microthrixaceae bacterium]
MHPTEVGRDGAALELVTSDGTVTVDVPPGAVTGTAEVGLAALRFDATTVADQVALAAGELWGTPVGIEHDAPLSGPVEVRWDLSSLTAAERASVVLVRFDSELGVWRIEADLARWEAAGDELVASIDQFSFWSWTGLADTGQRTGELTGARRAGARCSAALPDWVTGTVDTDEDTAAAALRTCFEGSDGEQVTVRQVNNRPFTQRLDVSSDTGGWAWTWPGADPEPLVQSVARLVFDTPTTHLL